MAIYMKWSDGIKGQVTAHGFEDDIEMTPLQFSARHPAVTAQLGATSSQSIYPSISEIVITKRLDLASPALFLCTLDGKHVRELEFYFTRTASVAVQTFLEIRLKAALFTGYSFSGTGVDTPVESLSINFVAIDFVYIAVDAAGKSLGQYPVTWDLRRNL